MYLKRLNRWLDTDQMIYFLERGGTEAEYFARLGPTVRLEATPVAEPDGLEEGGVAGASEFFTELNGGAGAVAAVAAAAAAAAEAGHTQFSTTEELEPSEAFTESGVGGTDESVPGANGGYLVLRFRISPIRERTEELEEFERAVPEPGSGMGPVGAIPELNIGTADVFPELGVEITLISELDTGTGPVGILPELDTGTGPVGIFPELDTVTGPVGVIPELDTGTGPVGVFPELEA